MKLCALIPSYNHHTKLGAIAERLFALQLPVILVDDASGPEASAAMQALAQDRRITLVRHEHNQGKGGAVMSGMQEAIRQGYTHALQVDADGQHDLASIPELLAKARQYPNAVISGKPEYDDSIPKGRKYGRYITHFWVWVETLSFAIEDAMCGLRVYPLTACQSLMGKQRLGKRMDFDIEILVRLYWLGTPSYFVVTPVHYPQDGLSHFQPFKDNVRISWLHTRLFFGMLVRLPVLLARKYSL